MGRYRLVLIIFIITSLLAACGESKNETSTIKVAVSAPLGLDIGQDVVNAAQLAIDEAGGKINGHKVELLVLDVSDPQGSPVSTELEAKAAQKAIADDAVVAYLGPMTSDQAKVSISLLNQASIAQVSQSATWPGLTKPGFSPGEPGVYYPAGRRHFFRVMPPDDVQGTGGARWASQLAVKRVYIIDDGTSYGIGVAGIFEVAATDLAIEVLGHDSLTGDTIAASDLEVLVNRVIEAQPDMVYFGGGVVPHGVNMIRALRTASPTLVIMGPDGLYQDELITDIGADVVAGIYVTGLTIPIDQLESAAAFAEKYETKYGKEPLPYIVGSYEGTKAILAAIKKTDEPTRENVLNAIANLGEFTGVFGTWQFDPSGDISLTTVSGWQIQNGEWTFVQVVE